MVSRLLHLSLKAEYFNQIKSGEKPDEYRLVTTHWMTRLVGRDYEGIVLTLGYPKADQTERHLYRPWRGYEIAQIQHDLFGPEPVTVFAIQVN